MNELSDTCPTTHAQTLVTELKVLNAYNKHSIVKERDGS